MNLVQYSLDEARLEAIALGWKVRSMALSATVPLDDVTDDELYVLDELQPDVRYGDKYVDFEEALRAACGTGEDIHIANPRFVSSPLRRKALVAHALIAYAASDVTPTSDDWKRGV